MISNVASLLRELATFNEKNIAAQNITHSPTIGAMYEGLTRELLNRTIPESLNLKIVSGFIRDAKGRLSSQIDCMLVSGDGKKLPHIDSFVWPIINVIAVIEVKKSLFGRELEESLIKQRIIHKMYSNTFYEYDECVDLKPTFRAFALLTGNHINEYKDAEFLQDFQKIIFHLMVIEVRAPIRIIFGYGGYASESSLRNAFIDFLESNTEHFGAFSLPNLVICGNNSLLKMSGYPYIARLEGEWWNIITSNSENPLRILIELIWSRLENQFYTSMPRDDNLKMERLVPLLRGKVQRTMGTSFGWIYEAVDVPQQNLTDFKPQIWAPNVMSQPEWTILSLAANHDHLDARDIDLVEYAESHATTIKLLFLNLVERRLLAWDGEHCVRLIRDFHTIITPDGKIQVSNEPALSGEWIFTKLSD